MFTTHCLNITNLRKNNNQAIVRHIILYTNNKCNMNCPYCLDHRKRTNKEFDLSLLPYLNKLCQNCHDETPNLKLRIMFLGGEPSLSPDIIEQVITSVPEYVDFEIMTNAYEWSKKFISVITKYKNRIYMVPSYDGLFQENRKKGSTEIVRKNIKWLIDNEFKVNVTCVVDKLQIGFLYENIKHLLKLSNCLFIKRHCDHNVLGNDKDYVDTYLKDIDKVVDLCTFKYVVNGSFISLPNRIENGNTIYCYNRRGTFSCHDYCLNEIIMDTDGTIYPCELYITDYSHPIGHIKTEWDLSEFDKSYNKEIYHTACPYWNEKINNNPCDCTNVLNDAVDKELFRARFKYAKMINDLLLLKNNINKD